MKKNHSRQDNIRLLKKKLSVRRVNRECKQANLIDMDEQKYAFTHMERRRQVKTEGEGEELEKELG